MPNQAADSSVASVNKKLSLVHVLLLVFIDARCYA